MSTTINRNTVPTTPRNDTSTGEMTSTIARPRPQMADLINSGPVVGRDGKSVLMGEPIMRPVGMPVDPHGPPNIAFPTPTPFPGPFPFPRPIPFPPTPFPPLPERPAQAELELMKARFEAQQNPGLDSDAAELKAAKADLKAYQTYEPNSPRVKELKQLVGQLDGKVTKEATQAVDDALNTWYQSGGTRADDEKLYQTLGEAQRALGQSAPHGPEMEFVKELRSYLQQQLFPRPPVIFY